MTEDVRRAWERRDDESERAFAAFRIYRDLNARERSLRAAAAVYYDVDEPSHGNMTTIERWSSKYQWRKRVRAFEQDRDRQVLENDLAAIKAMREQHITEARGLQSLAIEGLKRIQNRMRIDPDYLISPGMVLQLMQQGAHMERLSRGEPTEIRNEISDRQVVEVVWSDDEPSEDADDGADASDGEDAAAAQRPEGDPSSA